MGDGANEALDRMDNELERSCFRWDEDCEGRRMPNKGGTFDVMTPVELPSGQTVWNKIGKAFVGDRAHGRNRYDFKLTITALPVTALSGSTFDLYLFKVNERDNYYGKGEPMPEPVPKAR